MDFSWAFLWTLFGISVSDFFVVYVYYTTWNILEILYNVARRSQLGFLLIFKDCVLKNC